MLNRCCLLALIVVVGGCGGGGGGGGAVATPPAVELDTAVAFTKHRDPTTGVITPVLSESGSTFDAAEVDSPNVVIDSGRPNPDKYLLYYEATDASGVSTIGFVSSDEEDFETLTIARTQTVALGGAGSGFDVGATDPVVLVNDSVAFGVDGRYRMWFEGRSGAGGEISQIITASSGDGVGWSGFTICIGLTPAFGALRVADPTVLRDGPTFLMWFEGIETAGVPAVIGFADSTNGITWTVRDAALNTGAGADPVFLPGPAGSFDAFGVHAPSVVIDPTIAIGDPGRFVMFYEASNSATDSESTIGRAVSHDGLTWSNPLLPMLRPSSDLVVPTLFDSGDLEHPSAVIDPSLTPADEGFFLLWYTGDGENAVSPNRIGLARGRELP